MYVKQYSEHFRLIPPKSTPLEGSKALHVCERGVQLQTNLYDHRAQDNTSQSNYLLVSDQLQGAHSQHLCTAVLNVGQHALAEANRSQTMTIAAFARNLPNGEA